MKERNYGIDLLRMVSMLMVVINHIFRFGGVYNDNVTGISRMIIVCMDVLCLCAVNCFALTSGYVGVKARHRYSNIISLWILVVFYDVLFLAIFGISSPSVITTETVLQSLFPVLSNRYWYFTAYFALFFIMPLLNKGIQNLSDTQLRNISIAFVLLFSVLSTIGNFWKESIFNIEYGYSVLWLMVLYVIGAYLGRWGNSLFRKHKVRNWLLIYAVGAVLTIASKFVFGALGKLIGLNNSGGGELFTYNSPTILLESVGLFMVFVNLKIPTGLKKFISYFSPLAFSVYIVHFNKIVLGTIILDRFSFVGVLPFYIIPFAVLGIALCIYIGCTLLDILRSYLFKLIKVKKLSEWIEKKGSLLLRKLPTRTE